MVRFCNILGIRTIIEQPVNSRFFRHPDMVDPRLHSCVARNLISLNCVFHHDVTQAVMASLHLHQQVVQLGAFGARSPHFDLHWAFVCRKAGYFSGVCLQPQMSPRKPTQLVGDDLLLLRGLRHISLHPMLVRSTLVSHSSSLQRACM